MSYGDPSGSPNPFSNSPNPFSNSPNPYQTPATQGYIPPPTESPPVLAIISLVCGVLGIVTTCCCGILGVPVPIIAIVCGGIALAQPNSSGKGMAIAGVVLGVICLLLGIGLLILVIANPDFSRQMQQMQQMNK
jgi:hypothetical protein